MRDFDGRIAVVTGGGTGMGRELALQLAGEGCHVALCDIFPQTAADTRKTCEERAPSGTRITAHECDVSDESQVVAFRDAVAQEHGTDHVNLLFNNAGIGGGASFVAEDREEWDRTFAVCWSGVYHCSRAFMPLLVASSEGHIVNTSSVNGFWACLGPNVPHTAYSAAKFAVRGFSEALLVDLRLNAPHVKVSVVMPGHIGTSIVWNSDLVHGRPAPQDMEAGDFARARQQMQRMGLPADQLSDEQIVAAMEEQRRGFRDNAPVSAAQAAGIILDGVRNGQWRILVGEDAVLLDRLVRENPEEAYEPSFMQRVASGGAFDALNLPDRD